METTVYNQDGEESGSLEVPEEIFSRSWNPDLVHQVVVGMQANARSNIAHVKDRSEVSGGGTKPWRQKGTGRARHGSIRSPLWSGGGQSFGPTNEKDYSKRLNTQMKREALLAVLSKKFQEGEIVFVDELSFDAPKTAKAKEIIESLAHRDGLAALNTKKKNAALIAVGEKDSATTKSFRNFGNIDVKETRNINVVDLLEKKFCIITHPHESIAVLKDKINQKMNA
jgi:large subunit ribosomal protein L4